MGRQTSTIPKSTFFIKNKTKGRESILYIRYFVCGKYVEHSTGIKLPAADWDADTRQVRRSSPNYKRLSAQIDVFRSKTDSQILTCEERLTPKIVSDILNGEYAPDPKKTGKVDFIEYAATYNRQQYDLGRLGYSTYYNADLNIKKFGKFLKDRMRIGTLFIRISASICSTNTSCTGRTRSGTQATRGSTRPWCRCTRPSNTPPTTA